ncbi:MAG: ribonuclease [Actinomycetota bacterium]|nr:ribonuclease [Actinomycetota bacterium]
MSNEHPMAEPSPASPTSQVAEALGDTNQPAPEPASGATGDTAPDAATEIATGTGTGAPTERTPGGAGGPNAKRRRRGSRGGRNRKKPNRPATATVTAAAAAEDAIDVDDVDGDDDGKVGSGEDWNDAEADRGLTSEDLAADALDDAGLARPPRPARPASKPRIGDTRPAPAGGTSTAPGPSGNGETASTPAKKRRRRRGGRGRSKGTAAAGIGGAPAYVDAGTLGEVDVDGTDILDTLDESTLKRRRGTQRKGRPAGRYLMVVHQRPDGISQIAVLEGRNLVEHYVSHPQDDTTSIDGNIYLGRVQNVLPGMEAAFIDIGTPKNGVLYRGDVLSDAGDMEGAEKPRIERVLHGGQSIIVQVTKNPIGHKGARLTQEVSLAGRFVVMVPGQPGTYGISKRLPDDERRRLRRVLDRVRPSDAGLIVRTAAEGATEDELERDLRRLEAQWKQISDLAKRAKAGSLLYKEPELAIRIIREEFTKEYRGIAIDDEALCEEVRSYVDAVSPELTERVEYYDEAEENLPVFERFHVHEQLHKALDRKVWLPSGGSIIIERTEALTVIDVNTGKNVGSSNLEETVYRNNLEAADAVARELRLRDIGGIIVIDFIDMEIKSNRETVEEAFREALARDKTRTQVFPISELGLLEMTRKRVSEGLVEAFSETCPECGGRGFIVDQTMFD